MAKKTSLEKHPLFYDEPDTKSWLMGCEAPINNSECEKDATVEWKKTDADDLVAGDAAEYVTYRCDDHPVIEAGWTAEKI